MLFVAQGLLVLNCQGFHTVNNGAAVLSCRVMAVVLTHNRRDLLKRCVEHLRDQTYRPAEILVVNNGSTDGTEAMLAELGVRCHTQTNVGSAGGWYTGVERTLAEGYDAVWLMDDDGYPDSRALETLVAQLKPGVAAVSSMVVCENEPDRLVFPMPRLTLGGVPLVVARSRKLGRAHDVESACQDGLYPFAHFFNGALIGREMLLRAGQINRDYFIFGDELDYLYRLMQLGPVYTVTKALHLHPDVSDRPLSDVKIYYYIKNTFVINQHYLDWVWVRHALTLVAALGRTGRRNGWGEAWAYFAGVKRRYFWGAIVRGLQGRIGKDFRV